MFLLGHSVVLKPGKDSEKKGKIKSLAEYIMRER